MLSGAGLHTEKASLSTMLLAGSPWLSNEPTRARAHTHTHTHTRTRTHTLEASLVLLVVFAICLALSFHPGTHTHTVYLTTMNFIAPGQSQGRVTCWSVLKHIDCARWERERERGGGGGEWDRSDVTKSSVEIGDEFTLSFAQTSYSSVQYV